MNAAATLRADFAVIADWIKPGARVLDLGCGDGSLLSVLIANRGAQGYGVEIDDAGVLASVARGINVIQGNLERGLSDFADGAFDYVILSQTLQAMKNSERIVREMLRVGREGIVTFPNFGYWRNRLQVLGGHMPLSDDLPYRWYDTPNIHLCTLADFEDFCGDHGVRVLERTVLTAGRPVSVLPHIMGSVAVYRFERA